jgi:hypothetical protein
MFDVHVHQHNLYAGLQLARGLLRIAYYAAAYTCDDTLAGSGVPAWALYFSCARLAALLVNVYWRDLL